MKTIETEDKYISFDGKNKKKFHEWVIKKKVIGAKKGSVKALTKNLMINKNSATYVDKKTVAMNNLAYHHLVMPCTNKAYALCPSSARCG